MKGLKECGLKIAIKTNFQMVNLLDITLDIRDNTYE